MKLIGIVIYTILVSHSVSGQSDSKLDTLNAENIADKFEWYNKAHPSTLLFLHTDKTIYVNNETIWFSAYLIQKNGNSLAEHNVLSVALISDINHLVYLQSKFPLESGIGAGSLLLPDSITPGNYELIAYTNIVDTKSNPVAMFAQHITIKTTKEYDFIATLKLLDTILQVDPLRIEAKVQTNDGKAIAGAVINYTINKQAFKHTVTGNNGSCIVSIPKSEIKTSEFFASITYNNQKKNMAIKLPQKENNKITVHFYPEGGNISDGTINTIGWETKTTQGLPVPANAILYDQETPIDTIRTNDYGMGSFKLSAKVSSKYSLKIIDSIYPLPSVVSNVIAIHAKDAVIDDTLHFTISGGENKVVNILIHNYRHAYAFFPCSVQLNAKNITVALNEMPKGVAVITVLDHEGRPLAERLFYAHYDQKINAGITTDKQEYKVEGKVVVNIKLTDKKGKRVNGFASLACVQANRIENDSKQDIETYVYLNDELGHLPHLSESRGYDDKAYLENILLIKGWRRYTWQDLLNVSSNDTTWIDHALTFTGSIQSFGRSLKNSATLALASDSSLKIITTNNFGLFSLRNEDLIVKYNRKSWLLLNNKYDYTINITDPYSDINNKISVEYPFEVLLRNKMPQPAQSDDSAQFNKPATLAEVIIKTKKTFHPFFEPNKEVKGFNTNACGDFVCAMYGDLNCTLEFHDLSKTVAPIKGKTYHKLVFNSEGRLIMWFPVEYKGCSIEEDNNNKFYFLPGIYQSKTFYGADYDSPSSPQTQYLSTLFWSPAVEVINGEANFAFNTSNISGKFSIVIQGVSANDVFYGEKKIIVKWP